MNTTRTLTRLVLIVTAVTVAALGIAGLIGLATGGFSAGRFGGNGVAVDERKTLALTGVDLVSIEGVSDDVRIVEGTSDTLEAWLHGTAGTGSAAVPHLGEDRAGSTLTVRVERDRTIGVGFFWSNVTLEISVPRGYARKLAVRTVSGNVQVADHGFAGLALSTTSGDLNVGAVSAPELRMSTTSGDMSSGAVTSQSVDMSSVSGRIRVASLRGDAKLHTTSGDVNVTFGAVGSRVDASSTSGDVTLKLPEGARFQLDARSTSGDIACTFPITISQGTTGGGRHALAGAVGAAGAGAAQVSVHTVSGDIRIEK